LELARGRCEGGRELTKTEIGKHKALGRNPSPQVQEEGGWGEILRRKVQRGEHPKNEELEERRKESLTGCDQKKS